MMRRSLVLVWLCCNATTSHGLVVPWLRASDRQVRQRSGCVLQSSSNPLEDGELASALVRLNQKWELQQWSGRSRGQSRWTRLDLESLETTETESATTEAQTLASTTESFVYICEPPAGTTPSVLLVFTGGAVLGQYPHIAYSELLTRLADRLNAAVIASPYQVGLDHFGIAKSVGENARRAIVQCQDEKLYPTSLPIFCLAHSLGCKINTIYSAATGIDYDGVAFMAFNNYGFSKTIGMAREFANEIRKNTQSGPKIDDDLLESLFNLGEMAVSTMGIEFSPSPSDTQRLISMKYTQDLQQKTRLFVFDDDSLDCSPEFVENAPLTLTAGLEGSHLTPVFLKFGLDDLPEEARVFAEQATQGYKSAAFGDEELLEKLVDELSGFILGNSPSREASWKRVPPQLSSTGSSPTDNEDTR